MIIPVNESNIDTAAQIHSISWKESHKSFCKPDFIEMHTPERQKKYILDKIKGGSVFFMLTDDSSGKSFGIVSVTQSLIEDLYVLPQEQNKGFGTKLLNFACSKCTAEPTLWILQNNENAARLYRRRICGNRQKECN